MSGPNKTVAAFRNRKWLIVKEQGGFSWVGQAVLWAKANCFPPQFYRITRYKIGPRNNPKRYLKVTIYEKAVA